MTKKIFTFILMFFGMAFFMAIFYINRNFSFYNTNPLSQIVFHLLVQIDGANPTFIRGIVLQIIIIPLVLSIFAFVVLYGKNSLLIKIQETKFFVFIKKYIFVLSLCLFCVTAVLISNKIGLIEYIETYFDSSTLYEEEYVDPKTVKFDFPEKKRNLIYIFIESAETSDYSMEQGGAFEECYIPELYELAKENITFNNNSGFYVAPNTGWTIAGMIGQSSGVPLNIPIEGNSFVTDNKFMPGVYSIGDLLNDNGYKNYLLIGSDAIFGGRKFYYEKHGNYEIRDYNYALENEYVKVEDYVWWGYEDHDLFEFAKKDLLELSNNDEPFNYTMLTVDTHHNDGWICEYCENKFAEQLANVYSCSSKQASEFINWCKKQDFYENTTIVVAGDHCSMDAHFSDLLRGFDRKVYFTIINPSDNCIEKTNRIFSTLDVYPTTVASLGIIFDNNRLGLGTNLFSDEKTLCEKYGLDEFFNKLKKNSNYYNEHILYGIE